MGSTTINHIQSTPAEPSIRIIDFSEEMHIRSVSTSLRRIWLIDPPLPALSPGTTEAMVDEYSSSLEKCFHATIREVGNGIANDPPETRWDDALWLSKTNRWILAPTVVKDAFADDVSSVYSPWRMKLYDVYKHVFFDLNRMLKDKLGMEHLADFKPSVAIPTSLWSVTAGSLGTIEGTRTFGTDTFLYPVWLNPKATMKLSVKDEHYDWGENNEREWNVGLWLRGGKEVHISFQTTVTGAIEGEMAALFALAYCEERKVASFGEELGSNPRCVDASCTLHEVTEFERDTKEDGFHAQVLEADTLARGIFLRAGESVDHCTFDETYVQIHQELDDKDTSHSNIQGSGNSSIYEPLPAGHTIRILVLEAGPSGSELRTSLQVINLDDTPVYETMSYTWGEPEDKTVLQVQDHRVSIPRNLENALKRVRYPDRQRYIWADAVCINQEDIPERGQQVSIMRDIYMKAETVLVWLGEDPSRQAEVAFTAVCDIVRSWRPTTNRFCFSSYLEAFDPRSDSLKLQEESWRAVQAMFEAPYFSRFWVIQELVLSDSAVIFWGDHHISWGLIGICAAWCLTRGWPIVSGKPLTAAYNAFLIYVLPLAKRSGISSFSKLPLSIVMAATMERFHATDAKDRIFALLGLPFSGNDPLKETLVVPDYNSDIRSVYLEATKKMLTHDGHLRLLSAVQHGLEVDATVFPSWVPQYNGTFFAEPLALREEQGYYANAGELFFPGKDSFGLEGDSLILSGLECAVVGEASETFLKGDLRLSGLSMKDRAAMIQILECFNDEAKQFRCSWSSKVERYNLWGHDNPDEQAKMALEMMKAVITTTPGKYDLRQSTEMVNGEKPGADHLGEFLLYWRERCSLDVDALMHDDFAPFWEVIEKATDLHNMERALCSMNAFVGRKIFHSEDGQLVGLGPAAMMAGDIVTVLFGGIVPYVLRPRNQEGKHQWTFVGECFVPNLMQGEAVEAAGLLAEGTFERSDDGMLKLNPCALREEDPRFHREVGKNGVQRFEIR